MKSVRAGVEQESPKQQASNEKNPLLVSFAVAATWTWQDAWNGTKATSFKERLFVFFCNWLFTCNTLPNALFFV